MLMYNFARDRWVVKGITIMQIWTGSFSGKTIRILAMALIMCFLTAILPTPGLRQSVNAAEAEPTPTAVVNFLTETLTGLGNNAAYTINGAPRTSGATGEIPIDEAWMTGGNIGVVKVGDGTTEDSEPQILQILTRPATPSSLGGMAPTTAGGANGSIVGTTSAMEYRAAGAGTWADCSMLITAVGPAGDYDVRIKAVAGTNFRGNALTVTVPQYIPQAGVSLTPASITLGVGGTRLIAATVTPENATDKSVLWSSSDARYATVDVNGLVTAIAVGQAVITAQTKEGGFTDTCAVTVTAPIPVTGVTLSPSSMALTVGGTGTFYATLHPANATNQSVTWTSSNIRVATVNDGVVTALEPGSSTITVRTVDGNRTASNTVIVTAVQAFVPVSSLSPASVSMAMGATVRLNDLVTVAPTNATNRQALSWEIVSHTMPAAPTLNATADTITVPFGSTGTIVVKGIVKNGVADVNWGYPENRDYEHMMTINVGQFVPVSGITGIPTQAYVSKPLQLSGTVQPSGTSFRNIQWELTAGENYAGAWLDATTGILTAQRVGTVGVTATIQNGLANGVPFVLAFTVWVDQYVTSTLTLRADPGGWVSGAGSIQLAGGETIIISASPNTGYIFAGWYSTNGGSFLNANNSVTEFTMPWNATTVTAFFTYTGLPGGSGGGSGGGPVLPEPVHYFTNNSVYFRDSGVVFGHVTVRDFRLFSHVTLNGIRLTRDAHYTARQSGGSTEIILANGYLNYLAQGGHALTVHFLDHVTVTAYFSVVWQTQVVNYYSDVFSSDWYYSSVGFVTDRGWMTSRPTEPGRFRPSDSVTQGEVIDAFYRMAGSPSITNQNGQSLQGRAAALEWVRANGIMPLGGVYNLDNAVSRQDIAVLFGRMVNVLRLRYPIVRSAPTFMDEWQISAAARSSVTDLYRAGIIGGRTANTFVPLGNTTRAEFATMLQRFSEAMGRW